MRPEEAKRIFRNSVNKAIGQHLTSDDFRNRGTVEAEYDAKYEAKRKLDDEIDAREREVGKPKGQSGRKEAIKRFRLFSGRIATFNCMAIGLMPEGTLVVTYTSGGLDAVTDGYRKVKGIISRWNGLVAVCMGKRYYVGANEVYNIIGIQKDGKVLRCEIFDRSTSMEIATYHHHSIKVLAQKDSLLWRNISDWTCGLDVGTHEYPIIGSMSCSYKGHKAFGDIKFTVDGELMKPRHRDEYTPGANVVFEKDIVALAASNDMLGGYIALKQDGTVVGKIESGFDNWDFSSWRLMAEPIDLNNYPFPPVSEVSNPCSSCGGKMSGLFTKKCTYCGMKK